MSYMAALRIARRGARGHRYSVAIHYREPTYALRHGRPDHPYRYTLEVVAIDPDHAREKALREFHRRAALSSVSWVRQIERVMVTEA